MTKVYIVVYNNLHDDIIEGAFSTRELAQAAIVGYAKETRIDQSWYVIIERELDSLRAV